MMDGQNAGANAEQPPLLFEVEFAAGTCGIDGTTEAEIMMHVHARAELMDLLLRDPWVDALYWHWMHSTDFGRIVYEFIELLARTAEATGFGSAYALLVAIRDSPDNGFTVEAVDEADGERKARILNACAAELSKMLDAVPAAIRSVDIERMVADAFDLIRDVWGVGWPWMPIDLGAHWMATLNAIMFGRGVLVEYFVDSDIWNLPMPALSFETRAGETLGQALDRLAEAIIHPMIDAAATSQLPRGRTTDPNVIYRNVNWWYRTKIRGDSIRSMVESSWDNESKTIRDGIKRADYLLGLGGPGWGEDGDVHRPGSVLIRFRLARVSNGSEQIA